jgi:4-hydroxy-3-methylbut-2-enyl diphosphate reductase
MSTLIAVPLRVERLALSGWAGRRSTVVRVGAGPRHAGAAAARLAATLAAGDYDAVLIAGVAGGLTDDLRPGDLVLATEIRGAAGTFPCPDATELAGALRRVRSVHIGPIFDAGRIVDGADRAMLAHTGALAVDAESATLAAAAGNRPVLAVRAISDTPRHPLRSAGIVRNGLSALATLRAVGGLLADWHQLRRDEEVG